MSFPRMFDRLQLQTMRKSGMTLSAIAKEFGVGKGSVCKALQELKLDSNNELTIASIPKLAKRTDVSASIPALERLDRIAKIIEDELGYIQTAIKDTEGAERRAWEKIQIEHSAEIRKQLSLLKEIAIALHDVEQVEAFRQVVLDVIGSADEKLRKQILDELDHRRSFRNALGASRPSL
jgi:hypothetical protein